MHNRIKKSIYGFDIPGERGLSLLNIVDQIGRDSIYSDMFDLVPQRFGKLTGPYMAVQTLRTERWKLNIYPTAGHQYGQLFDLQTDPDEACNLYAERRYRDVREDMLWRLAHRCHVNTDPMPPYLTQF